MAQFTEHYGLHQWEPEDNFQREDFNEDFEKIDGAIQAVVATKAEVVAGYYSGNGATSREISLGFQPKALLVECTSGTRAGRSVMGGLAMPGLSVGISGAPIAVMITANGFRVAHSDSGAGTNTSGVGYGYLAFR